MTRIGVQCSPDGYTRIWKIQTMGRDPTKTDVGNEASGKVNFQHLQAILYAIDRGIPQGRPMGGDGINMLDSADIIR